MKINAKLNNLRIAPRKSRLVANLIKGMDVADAINQLDVHVKRTSPFIKKLLLSAIDNGENNFGVDKNNLYVFDVKVGEGPTLKRWMPKAFGRAGEILKRTSKIEIVLEERVPGKGRKTKDELEAAKKKKMEENKKEEKKKMEEQQEKAEKEPQKTDKEKPEEIVKEDNVHKRDRKKGWTSKIFRRKSM